MSDTYTLDRNLGYLLSRCSGRLAAHFERELAPYDISIAQWGALLAIHEHGEASPSHVAERVGIDRGATTRLLARMEAKDLICRKTHPTDARSVILGLTEATQTLMPELIARSKAVNRDALALLPEDDAETLLKALRRLLDGLEA